MKLKKLLPELAQAIVELGFDKEPKELQTLAIPKIKSGADAMFIAAKGAGKSTAIIMGVIEQLKSELGKAPRAIIITESKEAAFALDEQFEKLSAHTSLRSLLVYDGGKLLYQKDMIYEGIDVLITTTKRLSELMNNTGVPLVSLKMLVVDDAETLFKTSMYTVIHRIADGIDKLQILFFANQLTAKLENLSERVMKNPSIIQVD